MLDQNRDLKENRSILLFIYGKNLPAQDTNPYFGLRPEITELLDEYITDVFKDLIYYIDNITGHYRIYVPRSILKDIFQVVYSDAYLGYKRCFESIVRL